MGTLDVKARGNQGRRAGRFSHNGAKWRAAELNLSVLAPAKLQRLARLISLSAAARTSFRRPASGSPTAVVCGKQTRL